MRTELGDQQYMILRPDSVGSLNYLQWARRFSNMFGRGDLAEPLFSVWNRAYFRAYIFEKGSPLPRLAPFQRPYQRLVTFDILLVGSDVEFTATYGKKREISVLRAHGPSGPFS